MNFLHFALLVGAATAFRVSSKVREPKLMPMSISTMSMLETSGSSGEAPESGAQPETSGVDIIIGFHPTDASSGMEESGSGSGSEGSSEIEASGLDSSIWSPSDCISLPNGNYRLAPCAHRFLSCSNGMPFLMDCPAGLVYNAIKDQCDWPAELGCEDSMQSGEDASGFYSGWTSGEFSGIESSGDFSGASGWASGEFSGIEASGDFSGAMSGEIFIDASGQVLSITEVEMSGSGSGSIPIPSSLLVFSLIDCRALLDGLYPLTACSPLFVSCHASLPSLRFCSEGLIYNSALHKCDLPSNQGCEIIMSGEELIIGEGSGFSGLIAEDMSGSGSGDQFSGFSGETSGELSGDFSGEYSGLGSGSVLFFTSLDCASLSDGNYPLSSCSTRFLACSNGLPSLFDCPAGLFYNWDIDACDWPANLGCNFDFEGSASGSGLESSGDSSMCFSEGNFATGPCQSTYTSCIAGSRFVMSCDSGLLFSAEISQCVPAAQLNCSSPSM